MATHTIRNDEALCKGARSVYFDAIFVLDSIGMDIERLSETAYALAASELFPEVAQHSFYALGKLAEQIRVEAKSNEDRYTAARNGGEAVQ